MERYSPVKARSAARGTSFLPQADMRLRDPSLPTPIVDRSTQDRIGRELRALYADLARQPIPQRLLDLIGRLDDTKARS